MVKDPVCGIEIDPKTTKYSMEYHGAIYYFCSEKCLNDFTSNPNKYPGEAPSGHSGHNHGGMGGCCGGGGGGMMSYFHIAVMVIFLALLILGKL